MDMHAKTEIRGELPKWGYKGILLLGIAMGLSSIISGSFYFGDIAYLGAGMISIFMGFVLATLCIYTLAASTKRRDLASSHALTITAGYCFMMGVISIALAFMGFAKEGNNGGNVAFGVICLAIYFFSGYLLAASSRRLAIHKDIRKMGSVGSICLAISCLVGLIGRIVIGGNNVGLYVMDGILLLMGVWLFLSFNFKTRSKEEVEEEGIPSILPPPSIYGASSSPIEEEVDLSHEQEKIRILKEYKALYEDGTISKEEFEKKKKELLG